jgi:hypothetical protein
VKTSDNLELPIAKTKIDGPAVRGLALRIETNDGQALTKEDYRKSYGAVHKSNNKSLKDLGALKF